MPLSIRDKVLREREKAKCLERLRASASGYVLVRKFNSLGRLGMRHLIDEGLVAIEDKTFGKAYVLKG
jgi:hypothetical protein